MEGKRGSECLLKAVSNIDFNPDGFPHLVQSNVNYSNGYTRLPIKIPETILEIVSGHLFESDFRPYFKMFLDDPLG